MTKRNREIERNSVIWNESTKIQFNFNHSLRALQDSGTWNLLHNKPNNIFKEFYTILTPEKQDVRNWQLISVDSNDKVILKQELT